MGCDIHLYVEYRKTIKDKPKWYSGDYLMLNPYYDVYDDEESVYTIVPLYDDRNYDLFAILADVRNYCDNKYISLPKGLPKDVTKETAKESFYWGDDGHSHSYFTLRELLEFTPEVIHRKGYISKEAADELDAGVMPTSWCRYTNAEDYVYREWVENSNELEPLIKLLKQRAHELGVVYNWEWKYEPEKALEKSENIRIVFWFDN